MPKGYILGRIDILDAGKYAQYAPLATAAIAAHGGVVLARGGSYDALEGPARARNVVIEFESFEAAKAYYRSGEYAAARAARENAAIVEIVAVEGV